MDITILLTISVVVNLFLLLKIRDLSRTVRNFVFLFYQVGQGKAQIRHDGSINYINEQA